MTRDVLKERYDMAAIFVESIRDYASNTRNGPSLEQVVAHEIGHGALPFNTHASWGLMEAELTSSDLGFDGWTLSAMRGVKTWGSPF